MMASYLVLMLEYCENLEKTLFRFFQDSVKNKLLPRGLILNT